MSADDAPGGAEPAIWATLEVLPGQQEAAERFFAFSRRTLDAEPGTTSFFAVRIDESTYGIFDTFADQEALDAHSAGASGKDAVSGLIGTIFKGPPSMVRGVVIERGRAG